MPYGQKRIPIGSRREKVTLQVAVTSDDGMGGQAVTWQTVAEPWAAVQALDERTKESLMAQSITARHGYHVVIPYRSGVTPQQRLIVRDTTMQIHSVVDDEGKRRRRRDARRRLLAVAADELDRTRLRRVPSQKARALEVREVGVNRGG